MIRDLLAVATGGAIGATTRWGVALLVPFPLATLAVNVLGSFAIGAIWVLLGPRWMPFLVVGVLGGFTTFSAFSLDMFRLVEDGRGGLALVHLLGSVALPLVAVWLGVMAGRSWA